MCENCWREYGSPKLDSPQIREAIPLIGDVYKYHLAGGALHIVLDDWNLDDNDIKHCRDYVADDTEPEQRDAELACLECFSNLSIDERASALARYDGFLE